MQKKSKVLKFSKTASSNLAEKDVLEPWKIIIADDEPSVHDITRIVLKDFEFDGRKIDFLSAYSGKETIEILKKYPDTAVVYLDVVMEEDDAGLKVVKQIREELKNKFIRIILRTGQPGQAPENEVIVKYDINDYKEKVELTDKKLFTTTYTALRAYKDMMLIEKDRKIIKTSHDILRDNKKRYESIFNNAAIGILELDSSGKIIEANKKLCSILNGHEDSIVDKYIYDFVHEDELEEFKSYIKKLLDSSNQSFSKNQRFIKADKSLVWVNIILSTTDDDKGSRYFISTIEDVTLLHNAQEEIKRKDELLIIQSRQIAMGEMISMIAHQWRQPLSVISMTANNVIADIALEEVKLDVIETYMENINIQVHHMSDTIDDFRNFFKPDKGKDTLKISSIIEGAVNIIGKSIENNNIEITLDIESKSEVKLFKGEMIQTLLNLINNSKDVILDKEMTDGKISIKSFEDDKNIYIEISDNGGGIPKEIISKVFNPYFTTKGPSSGTGLGLYMSKMIVERHHNGTIKVNNINNGAIFKIILPIE